MISERSEETKVELLAELAGPVQASTSPTCGIEQETTAGIAQVWRLH